MRNHVDTLNENDKVDNDVEKGIDDKTNDDTNDG